MIYRAIEGLPIFKVVLEDGLRVPFLFKKVLDAPRHRAERAHADADYDEETAFDKQGRPLGFGSKLL